ncbi:GTPase-associated protein 1-related protein, partial [Actinocorallia lasiicapitis]
MFRQMYYTSCETGLSGYAGFQVNAATPDTPEQEFRRIEGLTAYEPPRSLGLAPTERQIRECPVNLCFDPGERPVVANVAFTGADYSGRFGNYFVHALIGDGAWESPPIELWGSPVWTSTVSPTTVLPPAEEPIAQGPLSRAAVARFLTTSGARQHLPALLAAAELAITAGERSVVLYDRDTDRIAHWIAALSYLLPPPLVERMSFSTYQHRPGYSRQHVIGTVPGADFEPSPAAFETFYLFDLVGGQISDVPDRPLVELLAGAGPQRAASIWRSAVNLGDGSPHDLADWHPVVLSAGALVGDPLPPDAVEPVLAWLEKAAGRLPAQSAEKIGRAILGSGGRPERDLARLAAVAGEAHADGLHEELEIALVRLQIAGGRGSAAPLRTPGGRREAEQLYHRNLTNDNLDELAPLVELAERLLITVDPALLADRGRERIGPALFQEPFPEQVRELLEQPSILAGALEFLAAEPFDRQVEAFSGARSGVVPERKAAELPTLRRA